jgi:hypothetical protein
MDEERGNPVFVWTFATVAYRGGKKALFPMTLGALPVVALLLVFKLFLVADAEALFPKTVGEALTKAGEAARGSRLQTHLRRRFSKWGAVGGRIH